MKLSDKLREDIASYLSERQGIHYENGASDTDVSIVFYNGFKGYKNMDDAELVQEFSELEHPNKDHVLLDWQGVEEYDDLNEYEKFEVDEWSKDYEKIKSAIEAIL